VALNKVYVNQAENNTTEFEILTESIIKLRLIKQIISRLPNSSRTLWSFQWEPIKFGSDV